MPSPNPVFRPDGHAAEVPVSCRATDYPAGHVVQPHWHERGQLVYAAHGVMVVGAEGGRWVVPPSRGLWMPAGIVHEVRAIGVLHMRSLYVHPDAAPQLPTRPQVVGISPLLRELIVAAVRVRPPYAPGSRDGRLMQLLLDELQAVPSLPLHLPTPSDAQLKTICARLVEQPDDASTLDDWAARLDIDAKTIQRRFARDTGMTFGQWRQQARLLRALEQLAHGEKVVDVALSLGYDSPGAFATMFKRQFGLTPSTFFR